MDHRTKSKDVPAFDRGTFRNAAAGLIKSLIRARARKQPRFLKPAEYTRWGVYLYGGQLDVTAGEDIEQLKTRMLSPAARTKRVMLFDNVKSMRLSWAELEALITTSVISGRQLYSGEGQRPNLLTWFITLNGVSMATDMAQRSVIIKVTRGRNSGPWW